MVENAKFSYTYVKKKDAEMPYFLVGRPPMIFRLRGTRSPAFDAHVNFEDINLEFCTSIYQLHFILAYICYCKFNLLKVLEKYW